MCVTSPPYLGLRDYGHEWQIGREPTIAAYVERLVAVFREVSRILTDDGTLWLNLGDTYGNKGLLGVPWRVALALQEDGWRLRSDIIWSKPNPMPESVTNRPTKSHEYLFLFAKQEKYYYDAEAISEPLAASSVARLSQNVAAQEGSSRVPGKTNGNMKAVGPRFGGEKYGDNAEPEHRTKSGDVWTNVTGKRNRRTVWTIPTQPFKGAHFATFPPALVEPCILAGSRPGDTVLDPFGGAGTTAVVAARLGRKSILCELNPGYVALARKRIADDSPLFNGEAA
jgi:DNA modification methylase